MINSLGIYFAPPFYGLFGLIAATIFSAMSLFLILEFVERPGRPLSRLACQSGKIFIVLVGHCILLCSRRNFLVLGALMATSFVGMRLNFSGGLCPPCTLFLNNDFGVLLAAYPSGSFSNDVMSIRPYWLRVYPGTPGFSTSFRKFIVQVTSA